MKIRVLVADDQVLVRSGFAALVASDPDFEVVAEAADGHEAVDAAARLSPDVALLDIRMPVMDGIEATRLITRNGATRVLVLTTFDLDEYVFAAVHAGASGFLLKDVRPTQLLEAIRGVHVGETLLSPAVTKRLVETFARMPAPGEAPRRLAALTDREVEVLTFVARGLSNTEIAAQMFLSLSTVKTHVTRILAKLGLRDRIQAVVLAYETGLVRPGQPAKH
jgi:DNA-binding NarL/FixJ family response regulator